MVWNKKIYKKLGKMMEKKMRFKIMKNRDKKLKSS